MSHHTMRDRFTAVASALLDSDPRTAVVLADIGVAPFRESGAMARHPDRVINVGIREQLLISVAAGMALEGMRPIAHSYASFLVERPFEQIKLDLAHQDAGAILVSVAASYDASGEGRTHQCPADIALLSTIPGFTIHVPGHPDEAEAFLRAAMDVPGPVYIRLSARANHVPVLEATVDGVAVVRAAPPGSPVVLAVGPMLDRTLDAAHGLDAAVLYAATVLPLDHAALRAAAAGARELAVVEPYLEGTTLPAIAKAYEDGPARLLAIGVPAIELRRYGSPADHERAYGLDAAGIRVRLERFLASVPAAAG